MLSFLLPFVVCILVVGGFSYLMHFYASALWVRIAALGMFVFSVPVSWFLISNSMGLPKPTEIAFLDTMYDKEVILLAKEFDRQHAIYIWVVPVDSLVPVSYVLPWSDELAKKLQEGEEAAEQAGVKMKLKGLSKIQGTRKSDGVEVIVPVVPPKRKVIMNKVFDENRLKDSHHAP